MQYDDDYLNNPLASPTPEIMRLEAALAPLREIDVAPRTWDAGRRVIRRASYAWTAAAALILVVSVHLYGQLWRPWTVIDLGRSVADIATLRASRSVVPGDLIVTQNDERARLNLGAVGHTEIAPASRVRIVSAAKTGYRLALEEGEIHARIWAPPRFFTVATRAGMAIDLGCVYTLRATPDGRTLLRVSGGEVELHHEGGVVVVPAGNEATVGGPASIALTIPSTAHAQLRSALNAFVAARDDARRLNELLAATDERSTIVLWHLLSQVQPQQREAVYERLSGLVTLPHPGRAQTVALHQQTLDQWRAILEPGWSTEHPGWAKRQLRKLWRLI